MQIIETAQSIISSTVEAINLAARQRAWRYFQVTPTKCSTMTYSGNIAFWADLPRMNGVRIMVQGDQMSMKAHLRVAPQRRPTDGRTA